MDLWRAVVRRGRWGNYEGGKNIGQKGQETNEEAKPKDDKVMSGENSSPPAPMPTMLKPPGWHLVFQGKFLARRRLVLPNLWLQVPGRNALQSCPRGGLWPQGDS